MLIINEKKFVENAIKNPKKFDKVDIKPRKIISLFVAYKQAYMPELDVRKSVVFFFRNARWFNIGDYEAFIVEAELNELPLKENESIVIYQNDIKDIEGLSSDLQKLYITILALSRFYGRGRISFNNPKQLKNIFTLANISRTVKERPLMIRQLVDTGIVLEENFKIVVKHRGTTGLKIALEIKSMNNIGKQLVCYFDKRKIICLICGAISTRRSNRQVYCSRCAEKISKINKANYNNNYYETRKNSTI